MTVDPIRTFSPGDPGMPKNGLLVGSGGGWSTRYTDYVLHIDGTIEKLEYETDGGPIPDDYTTTAREVGAANDVIDFDGKLTANGFWSGCDIGYLLVERSIAMPQVRHTNQTHWASMNLPDSAPFA